MAMLLLGVVNCSNQKGGNVPANFIDLSDQSISRKTLDVEALIGAHYFETFGGAFSQSKSLKKVHFGLFVALL